MKNEKYINSGMNDCITIIASAAENIPGFVRISSGDFIRDRQFRYSKCEIFTVDIQKETIYQIHLQDVRIYYCYLFKKDSSVPIQRDYEEKSVNNNLL